MLGHSERPLSEVYDLAMLDLDGVVYVGADAVPGAAAHLDEATRAGLRCAFVTNNASRPPSVVVEHLGRLGVTADVEDVVTSAQAAASVLRDRHGAGARVLVLGGTGLWEAVAEAGLEGVRVEDHDTGAAGPVALVTGYGPEVTWREIMLAAVLVRDGLPWVASNTDLTIPTALGVAPGHGVLVDALRRFSEVDPVVAGKPQRPLLEVTVSRTRARRPLMVGDRVDTDIEGGINLGADTLLVMTGVTGLQELVSVAEGSRPTYLAADLAGLLQPHPQPCQREGSWWCAGWTAQVARGRLAVDGEGSASDWWRVVAAASWEHLDRHGAPVAVDGLEAP